jgi:hypothetical protein
MKKNNKQINIKESEYKKSKKALETLESVKTDINEVQKQVWKIKNKVKQR